MIIAGAIMLIAGGGAWIVKEIFSDDTEGNAPTVRNMCCEISRVQTPDETTPKSEPEPQAQQSQGDEDEIKQEIIAEIAVLQRQVSELKISQQKKEEDERRLRRVPTPNEGIVAESGRWKKGNQKLGAGGFGEVFLGLDQVTGKPVALKIISVIDGKCTELQREVEVLSRLQHPNIVAYYGAESDGEVAIVAMEYVAGGSLMGLLEQFTQLPLATIRVYLPGILCGLSYLHKNGIIHRDIKPGNILVDTSGVCKLADFGSAKLPSKTLTATGGVVGTPLYIAPEQIASHATFASDIWSLGMTVQHLASGRQPWSELDLTSVVPLMFHIAKITEAPKVPADLDTDLRDLILQCLQIDYTQRPTCEQLLHHQFLQEDNDAPIAPDGDQKDKM
eukprot:TRINITY_DN96731_c0_g1_i1.p1 TRINITY_DN96731_c0_g1~~TRINITY_DN96731_c0_g1_i1.p1  ORF type:complete len:402 (+),score=64.65 TRINITY_DN96731_c0_g1_i1:39-1208(+)